MKRLTLSQRLMLVFILLLIACCAISGWLQVRSASQYSQAVTQQLSVNLASQIVSNNPLLSARGLDPDAVHQLFDRLMAVNPSVEVYLLDSSGKIIANAAPPGKLRRERVSLTPVHALQSGAAMPVYGDNPRDPAQPQVFSAAPLKIGGRIQGYVYIILQGEEYSLLASAAQRHSAVLMALRSMGLVLLLGGIAGFFAFRWITRPVRRLTAQVVGLDDDGIDAIRALAQTPLPRSNPQDEVALLQQAFVQLAQRIDQQWQSLTQQDQLRREFVANISHDLRTPLTSLHGYLETLSVKADTLSAEDRQRYLATALAQSKKVGRLAQELFELARLEYGVVKPQKETFCLSELVQDVMQKFELMAEARHQQIRLKTSPGLPLVTADLGMMERVLTNLLDNALRHTPQNGLIEVEMMPQSGNVMVQVNDSGPGIAAELREDLFVRPSLLSARRHQAGGLGLMIVRRILQLHDSDIKLVDNPQRGACFQFFVPV